MKIYVAASLLALVVAVQGGVVPAEADTRIFGGTNAELGQFPWQAHITMDQGAFFCAGALISPEWIITAGHCVDSVSTFSIVLGNLIPGPGSGDPGIQSSTSRTHVLHTGYNGQTIDNDIGLIKLERNASTTMSVKPVLLPTHAQVGDSFAGLTATVSGWGKTSYGSSGYAETLQWVDLPVITNTICDATYTTIKPEHICASGENGRSTCIGDSGSPLVRPGPTGDFQLIGILSYDYLNCERDYPAVFTRITSYLDWITTNSGIVIG